MSPPQRSLLCHPATFVPTPLTSCYHISPSVSPKPFAQSDAFLFCFITCPLAIVCAVRWNVQLHEAGTSDRPLLMTVSPASDPSQGSTNISEWAGGWWRHAPGNSGRLCFSLSPLVQPPLALIAEKCVSTGSPCPHAVMFLCPWLMPSASGSGGTPGSRPRPRRPGEGRSEERRGFILALPSDKPAHPTRLLVLTVTAAASAEPGRHQPGGWRGRWRGYVTGEVWWRNAG